MTVGYLVVGFLLTLLGSGQLEAVNALYSIAQMLRTPGYYVTFLSSVHKAVDYYLEVRQGAPPPECREYAEAVIRHDNWDVSNPDIRDLLRLLNGEWWDNSALVHYLGNGADVIADRVALVRNITRALLVCLFSSMPMIPMVSRWTKVFGSLQWFYPGIAAHNVFIKVYRLAFEPAFADVVVRPAGEEEDAPIVPGPQELSREEYRKMIGRRMKNSLIYLRDDTTAFNLSLLTVLMSPLNFITAWMLKMQGERHQNPLDGPSMILDMQWGPRSPIVMALQWYASILKLPLKDGPLQTLLGTLPEGQPTEDAVATIHVMVLAISAGLVLRFVLVLSQWPWKMLILGDDRRPGDHERVSKDLVASRLCCVDKAGTGAVLKSMVPVRSFELCSTPEYPTEEEPN